MNRKWKLDSEWKVKLKWWTEAKDWRWRWNCKAPTYMLDAHTFTKFEQNVLFPKHLNRDARSFGFAEVPHHKDKGWTALITFYFFRICLLVNFLKLPDHKDRGQTVHTTWDWGFRRQFCSCSSLFQAWTAMFQLII